MTPHWVHLQVRADDQLGVGQIRVRVQGLGQEVGVLLEEDSEDPGQTWTGAVQLPDVPRFYRLEVHCEDVSTSRLCFEALRFPTDLTRSEVAVRLVGRPGGVWGRVDTMGDPVPLSAQFGGGLAVLALAGLLVLRRLSGG